MHKSYKYILIVALSLLVFTNIFVQKVSANTTNYSEIFSEQINMYSDIKPYYFVTRVDYNGFFVAKLTMFETPSYRQSSGYRTDNPYYFEYNSSTKVMTETLSSGVQHDNFPGETKLVATNHDILAIDGVTVAYSVQGFPKLPLTLQLEKIPMEIMKGALTILPVGLVVLSILLGIALIPRLINYFRR